MSDNFEEIMMATYAELCVTWRMEYIACRSNADQLNLQLSSLEKVFAAFGIGDFDLEAAEEEIPPPTISRPNPRPKSRKSLWRRSSQRQL